MFAGIICKYEDLKRNKIHFEQIVFSKFEWEIIEMKQRLLLLSLEN